MTLPGAPNIFYGDEIGLTGGPDPACRRAFPWEDKAAWDEELRQDVKSYIALRRETPALRHGRFRIIHATDALIIYERADEDETAVIAFNIANVPFSYIPSDDAPGPLPQILNTTGREGKPWQAGERQLLNGRSAYVWAG
jgi:neopullulanase